MQSFITGSFLTHGGPKPGDEGYRISHQSGGGVDLTLQKLDLASKGDSRCTGNRRLGEHLEHYPLYYLTQGYEALPA